MARLYLFAEGQTEQTFADILLRPHLATFGVYLHGVILIAKARKKGVVHRGGGHSYVSMKKDIERKCKEEKGADVFFTTMLDLYAIHSNFPGLDESERYRQVARDRAEFLERALADDIGDTRFMPHIQLHEYEAYLFSDPTQFSIVCDDPEKQVAALTAIAEAYDTPEKINDGPDSASSKRIHAVLRTYKKAVNGPRIAERIGLDTIRNKCPHFNSWLSRLEGLGDAVSW
jgi:hypothetical protein